MNNTAAELAALRAENAALQLGLEMANAAIEGQNEHTPKLAAALSEVLCLVQLLGGAGSPRYIAAQKALAAFLTADITVSIAAGSAANHEAVDERLSTMNQDMRELD